MNRSFVRTGKQVVSKKVNNLDFSIPMQAKVSKLIRMARRCMLRCTTGSYPDIALPDGEEVIVGRSKETKIQDSSCSRQQISLKANFSDCTVQLRQLGFNSSGLDGFSMQRDSIYHVGHGSAIEILLDKYTYKIEFDPPPVDSKSAKRKQEESPDRDVKMSKNETSTSAEPMGTPTTENTWECIDKGELYIFTTKGVIPSSKIAAYDLDGTIIKTRSNKVFPVDITDWQIAFPQVFSKLKSYYSQGYKVVFLTNQAPIGSGRVKIHDFKKKLEAIVAKLSVPVQAFIATGKGMYRKPMTGMWDVLVEEKNNNLPIDMEASFYCGDAAGRINNWAPGKKKDHSIADRLLAENVGLKFCTPEEHFLDHPQGRVPFTKPEFDPRNMETAQFHDELISSTQEVLVLVGFPGSGKSFLAQQIKERSGGRYVSVCRDDLGSWQKCASEAQKLLKSGKSVIVDSTNPDAESRARWVSVAREAAVQARCAHLAVGLAQARHNNKFRELLKTKHAQVTDVVFYSYKNKLQPPTTSEGFEQVLTVKFSPHFDSEESERLYSMHLLEK